MTEARPGPFEWARRLRAGELTARQLVDRCCAEIDRLDPRVRAVVERRYEAARAEADAADRRFAGARAGDELPPLLGVPFTVKECIGVAGQSHTVGSVPRRDWKAREDATVVARLRAAGAIPVAMTNLPELAFWMECDNPIYGRTLNPHAPDRTPGGSSGGEAAIVALGATPFGVGSDGGGSLRMPAAFCGIFAHKPTGGALPITGHFPVIPGRGSIPPARVVRQMTVGPMARSAADLPGLLALMAGPDGIDPAATGLAPDFTPRDVAGRRVFLLEDPRVRGAHRVRGDLRARVAEAGRALAARGARVEPLEGSVLGRAVARELRAASGIWLATFGEGNLGVRAALGGDDGPLSPPRETWARLRGRARHSVPALLFSWVEAIGHDLPGVGRGVRRLERSLRERGRALEARVAELLEGDALLVLPTQPGVAPRHRRALLRPNDAGFTAIFNSLALPVTAVPVGRAAGRGPEAGLPLGVQIVGPLGADGACLGAALVLEEHFGGWVRPGGI